MKAFPKLSIDEIPAEYLKLVYDRMHADWDTLCARKEAAKDEMEKMDAEIDAMEYKLAVLEAEIDSRTVPVLALEALEQLAKTPTGRVKRGVSEGVIKDFLKQRNGSGASINEITDATKTKYATARRILHIFKDQSLVTQSDDSRWHWKQPST